MGANPAPPWQPISTMVAEMLDAARQNYDSLDARARPSMLDATLD